MKGKIFTMAGKWSEKLGRYRYVLLISVVGVLLLLLPSAEEKPETTEVPCAAEAFDLEDFERQLEEILSRIEGAGETKVILSLRGGSRQILALDEEWEGDGAQSSSHVTVGEGAGVERVVPLQTVAPEFRGALVVCPGGGNPRVRLELTSAVSALTGLGADRISVCAGKA